MPRLHPSLNCPSVGITVMQKICKRCGKLYTPRSKYVYLCPECAQKGRAESSVRLRKCVQCGAEFEGGPRARYCPICRRERELERKKKYNAQGFSRHIGDKDYCEICGKEYTVSGGGQRYCPDCAKNAIKEADRKAGLEYYHQNKDAISEKKKENSVANLKNIPLDVCVICGKPVERRNSRSPAVCSDKCYEILKKQRQREYDRRRTEKEK